MNSKPLYFPEILGHSMPFYGTRKLTLLAYVTQNLSNLEPLVHKANKGLYHTPLAVYFWQATLTDNSLEAYSTPRPPLKKRQKK